MAYQEEEVYGLRSIDCINKPLLFCQVRSGDDFGVICVAFKVEEDPECHDSDSEGGCEIAIPLPNVFEFASGIVQDLDVRSHIFAAIVLTELGEGFVGSISQVELMVPNSKKVIVDVLKDRVRDVAVG